MFSNSAVLNDMVIRRDWNTLYNGPNNLRLTCNHYYNLNFNIWGGTNGVSGNMMNKK